MAVLYRPTFDSPGTAMFSVVGEYILLITKWFFLILVTKPTVCTDYSNLFWSGTLHVSDSSSVHHQEFFTVHTAIVYVIQVC